MVLWRRAAISMDARFLQPLDQSHAGLFTTRISIERQDHRTDMRRKPISTDCCACQSHHVAWLYPCAEQRQPVKCTLNQYDISGELIWVIAEPACRVSFDP